MTLLVLLCGAVAAAPQAFPEERRLAAIPPEEEPILDAAFSEDGPGFAYVGRSGAGWVVVSNGRRGEAFEWIRGLTVRSGRVAYAGERAGRRHAVLDGVIGPGHDDVEHLAWGLGGRALGYIATSPGGVRVVVSGQPGPVFQRVHPPSFSRAEADYAYAGFRNGRWAVVHNGNELTGHEPILLPDVAARGHWFVFAAKHPDGMAVLVNDRVVATHPKVHALVVSPDETSWAGIVSDEAGYRATWGDRRYPPLEFIHSLTFSPTSRRLAYIGTVKESSHLVVDGEVLQPGVRRAREPLFSPDGSRAAFLAGEPQNGPSSVVVDGRRGPEYDAIHHLRFSPDSRHLAYVGLQGRKTFLVIHGRARLGPYAQAGPPVFSKDSRKVGYGTREGRPDPALDGGGELWWRIHEIRD